MTNDPGLRERKKQRTRALIADTARTLFVEHGFDAVPVAAIARAAEVSEGTIFNYFPTKEDLALHGIADDGADLVAVVRDRPPTESVTAAFARAVRATRLIANRDPDVVRLRVELNRMIATSTALQAKEREILSRNVAPLAAMIAEDTGADPDDLRPWVVARALVGVHETLLDDMRRRMLEDVDDPATVQRRSVRRGEEAFALLDAGLASYGIRET